MVAIKLKGCYQFSSNRRVHDICGKAVTSSSIGIELCSQHLFVKWAVTIFCLVAPCLIISFLLIYSLCKFFLPTRCERFYHHMFVSGAVGVVLGLIHVPQVLPLYPPACKLSSVALNQRPLKIETHPRLLVQRLEMSVKYSSVPPPVFRNVHRTEALTPQW